MRTRWLFAVATLWACAGHRDAIGHRPAPTDDDPPATDAALHLAAAARPWLAGDLDAAIAELEKAGGDPQARALLARAYLITERWPEAERTAARALAHVHPEPRIATDVTKIDTVAISPDGAFVATTEASASYTEPATITVWSTLAGRALYVIRGDRAAFGRSAAGEMRLVVIPRDAGKARALDAATGVERWSHDVARTWDFAIDRHDTLTTVMAPDSTLVQWSLSTGAKLREVPNDSHAAVISMAADGKTALAAETLLDLTSGAKLAVLPAATLASGIDDMSLSPDGQTIAVSNRDGRLDLAGRDGKSHAHLAHAGWQAQFLDDNTVLATDGVHVTHWDHAGKPLAGFDLPADLKPVSGIRLAIGTGGHAVVRHGAELAVLQLTAGHPTVISRFGLVSRASKLAWSPDGTKLALANANNDVMTWTVADGVTPPVHRKPGEGLHFDAAGNAVVSDAALSRITVDHNRVFVRDAKGHVARFVEAVEPITAAALGGGRLVGAGPTGVIYLWNAETAEGFGAIPGDSPVSALAVRADGNVVAIARASGGIELWDLPSRSHVLTLVTWADGWLALTPSGHFEGKAHPLAWIVGAAAFPGEAFGRVEHGVAAAALAHPPRPVAIPPTPAPKLAARSCVPSDVELRPISAVLAGNVFSYCVADQQRDPFCFAFDLTTRAHTAVAPPLDVIAPGWSADEPPAPARVERTDTGVEVCVAPDSCHTLPLVQPETAHLAVSDDGAVLAIGDATSDFVETWNVIGGKRIARFKVRYGTRGSHEARSLAFWAHDVLAISTPCAGPCGDAVVFDAHGKELGPLGLEASSLETARFHDDSWVLSNPNEGFSIRDALTGAVLASRQSARFSLAVSPDHVAAVLVGKPLTKIIVLGRLAKVVAETTTPRCH